MKLIDAEPLEELLHSRAAQCSNDFGSLAGAIAGCLKLVQAQPVISTPPNPPLTLEELREMGSEWVWLKTVAPFSSMDIGYYLKFGNDVEQNRFRFGYPDWIEECLDYADYGKTWLAYRRKPEDTTA